MRKNTLIILIILLMLVGCSNKNDVSSQSLVEDMFMKYSPDYERKNILATDTELKSFMKDLDSKSIKTQYIAINRLVESYNSQLKPEVIIKIEKFRSSENDKLKQSAELVLSVLEDRMESEYIHKMYDNSYIFTYFNNYSDYGTSGTIFLMKENKLSILYILKPPGIFLQEIKISADKKQFALYTKSNKSDFILIYNFLQNTITPDLIGFTREKYHNDNGLDYIEREDFETYSTAEDFGWSTTAAEFYFEVILRISETNNFDNTAEIKKIHSIYNTTTNKLD